MGLGFLPGKFNHYLEASLTNLDRIDGSVTYKGTWKDDQPHGKGIYFYRNGEIYRGEYDDGECSGQGEYLYPNGGIFQGFYKDGVKHGKGKKFDPVAKDIVIGSWEKDTLVEIEKYFEVDDKGEAVEVNPQVYLDKFDEA
jgi:hypothetical protein